MRVGRVWAGQTAGGIVGLVLATFLAPAAAAAGTPSDDAVRETVVAVAGALCPEGLDAPKLLEGRLPGYALAEVEDSGPADDWLRRRVRLVAAAGDLAVTASGLRPGGILRRVDIEVRTLGGDRPLMLALADGDCRVFQGRVLRYREGSPAELLLLAPDMATVTAREPLDPPVPAGSDPAGVTVAHVDSGVNYLLPPIAARLARDPAGQALGYDFWDLDPRPFDGDTGRSPFFPLRHGTEVASLLLAEAPVRLLPFRYPRPDMTRMADLVERAAAAGAVIVALPMGSRRPSDWTAFAAAAQKHDDMLFIVSAGNDGRDIDAAPVYPAALALDNLIVVTSAERDGHVAPGANWGAAGVDLLVPAENLEVTGFDGRPTQASGSSFAVPRVAALAARLKAAHPAWQAAELKAAIFTRAVPPPPRSTGTVAVGWLPEVALTSE